MEDAEPAAVGIDFEHDAVIGAAASLGCADEKGAGQGESAVRVGAVGRAAGKIEKRAVSGAVGVHRENRSQVRGAANAGCAVERRPHQGQRTVGIGPVGRAAGEVDQIGITAAVGIDGEHDAVVGGADAAASSAMHRRAVERPAAQYQRAAQWLGPISRAAHKTVQVGETAAVRVQRIDRADASAAAVVSHPVEGSNRSGSRCHTACSRWWW